MIVVLVMWLIASALALGLVVLFVAQAPPVSGPLLAHPRASMRLVFVSVHDGRLVVDGLLDLEPPSSGVPTAWSFAVPDQPVLAAATRRALESWADDGEPVRLDLSRIDGSHPTVGFTRGEVLVRLSALPRGRVTT